MSFLEQKYYQATRKEYTFKKTFFLFPNQNICCWYSKEPSQWGPKTNVKLDGSENIHNFTLKNYFSYFSTKTYVVGTQKNRLNETVLLSTQNT